MFRIYYKSCITNNSRSKCGYEDSSFIPIIETSSVQCPHCKENVERNIIKKKYEDYMTMQEYLDLVKFIDENHSFKYGKGKMIKYINMTLDFRTTTIHGIKLNDKEFYKVNQNRHRNLLVWIMDYLKS